MHKKACLLGLGSLLLQCSLSLAQDAISAAQAAPREGCVAVLEAPTPLGEWTPCCSRCETIWANAEFLLWWTKSIPAPTPMLTQATNLADPTSGQLGSANTAILLGGQSYDPGTRFGGRFTFGGWLDANRGIGLEGTYLFIAPSSTTARSSTDGSAASPLIGSPIFNAFTGKEDFLGLAGPGFAGGASLTVSNELQSGELNLVKRLYEDQQLRITGLIGFRYVSFDENLVFSSSNHGTPGNDPGSFYSESDHFGANNNFYGANFGLRGEYQMGRVFVNASAKCALGAMNQTVNISGSATDVGPGGPPFNFVLPTGIFAVPTNIGSHNQTVFAVVPEANFNLGYAITNNIRATVGYSFLYLSNVARPGTAVDHAINPTQSYSISSSGSQLIGTPAPTFSFSRSDFWAQGINFGLEFKF